eukprot:2440610-Pleurochrysis_carterae.AAC.11
MFDGIQIVKQLKFEVVNSGNAYDDADQHKRKIERMQDERLPGNCTGQEFHDKVNILIEWHDHNPYIQMLYVGERLGQMIIKFLTLALACFTARIHRQAHIGQPGNPGRGDRVPGQDGACAGSSFCGVQRSNKMGQTNSRSGLDRL